MKCSLLISLFGLIASSTLFTLAIASVVKSPKESSKADNSNVAMIKLPPTPRTNWINFIVTGIPTNNGAKGFAYIPIDILWSDDNTNWNTSTELVTNGFSINPTNAHRYYRLLWDKEAAR